MSDDLLNKTEKSNKSPWCDEECQKSNTNKNP